jgi:formylglycine-generating enzyme required for sulfatase activity
MTSTGAALVVSLCLSTLLAQADDIDSLKTRVLELRSRDRYDAAGELLRAFKDAHPAAADSLEFRRLAAETTELTREADALFQKKMAQGEKLLDDGKYAEAIGTAASALSFYPERSAKVKEFQARVLQLQSTRNVVRVEGGTYRVGSEVPEDENPRREVTVKAFLIDRYPVTNAEYLAFVTATDRATPPHWPNRKYQKGLDQHPVVLVTWEDATAYARWAGKRLPSAEEWEIAAGGREAREFPWGAARDAKPPFPCNCLEYWQVYKTKSPTALPVDAFDKERPAATAAPSMGGNVWEWTLSGAPGKTGDGPQEFRILKGGSFMMPMKAARCANNFAENPRIAHPDVGFRCAKDRE